MLKDDALNAIIGDTFVEDPRSARSSSPHHRGGDRGRGRRDRRLPRQEVRRTDAPVPKVINKFSKDIAVYNLFSRVGIDEGSEEKNYSTLQCGDQVPHAVAEGKVSIGAQADDPKTAAATGFS
jgi:hypothetical protein